MPDETEVLVIAGDQEVLVDQLTEDFSNGPVIPPGREIRLQQRHGRRRAVRKDIGLGQPAGDRLDQRRRVE